MKLAKIAIEKRYLKYKLYIEHSTRQAHTRTHLLIEFYK